MQRPELAHGASCLIRTMGIPTCAGRFRETKKLFLVRAVRDKADLALNSGSEVMKS